MDRLGIAIVLGAALAAAAPSAQAQIRSGGTLPSNGTINQPPRSAQLPPGQMPPAGMCRIWIDGVPAGRQPAPTDCGTAQRRNLPPNSRIIYGSQAQGTYGNGQYDPRRDSRNSQYDPRRDPRSGQYDPRLDPRNNGRNGTYGRNDDRGNWDRNQQERDKADRKQDKERQKESKKENKDHRDHGNGNGHDDGDNGQHGQNGHRGNDH